MYKWEYKKIYNFDLWLQEVNLTYNLNIKR